MSRPGLLVLDGDGRKLGFTALRAGGEPEGIARVLDESRGARPDPNPKTARARMRFEGPSSDRERFERAARGVPGVLAVTWEEGGASASVEVVRAALDLGALEVAAREAGLAGRMESHETLAFEVDAARVDARFAPLLAGLWRRPGVARVLADLSPGAGRFLVTVTAVAGATTAEKLAALARERGFESRVVSP